MGISDFWSQSNNNSFFNPNDFKKGDEFTLDELARKLNVDREKLQSLPRYPYIRTNEQE